MKCCRFVASVYPHLCLGISHDNFQLHRFTISENIAKSVKEATFLTHTVYT